MSGNVIGRWFHGAAVRTRPLEPIDTQRLQWLARSAGWSQRILLEGVREVSPRDTLWSDLLDAEQLLRCTEEEPPSEHGVAALLDHPSHHVRGFGWLAALQLHELARPLGLDLVRYADSEAPRLRMIAAWVLTSTHAREVPLAWLEEALADTAPRRIQGDALSLLRFIRPEPYRALAPKVAHIAKSEPGVWSVLCRVDPEVWRELLPIAEEEEAVVLSEVTRKRREARGTRPPATQRSERACHAHIALFDSAEWLPDEAITAMAARAKVKNFADVLGEIGPRARAAVPALMANATPSYWLIDALVRIGGPEALQGLDVLLAQDAKWASLLLPMGDEAVPVLERHAPHLLESHPAAI